MNNPLEFIKAIKNPREFVINYAKQNNNPMINNLIQMAEKKDTKGLENFAKNFFEQQGQDFNKIKEYFK
jgi:flagellar motor component MotA